MTEDEFHRELGKRCARWMVAEQRKSLLRSLRATAAMHAAVKGGYEQNRDGHSGKVVVWEKTSETREEFYCCVLLNEWAHEAFHSTTRVAAGLKGSIRAFVAARLSEWPVGYEHVVRDDQKALGWFVWAKRHGLSDSPRRPDIEESL